MPRYAMVMAGLLLAGCQAETASYLAEGSRHALTVVRQPAYPWSETVDLELVVTRLPECQRRFTLKPMPANSTRVDVFVIGDTDFALRQGKNWYAVDSAACTARNAAPPEEGPPGRAVGRFQRKDDGLRFVAAEERPVADAAE